MPAHGKIDVQTCLKPGGSLDALEKRWLRFAERKDWVSALEVADAIAEQNPDEPTGWIWQSVCLHKLRRTQDAKDHLLAVVKRFPKVPIIHYHLACYTCQLGDFTESSRWWGKALMAGNKEMLTMMAANEDDLKPLWQKLGVSAPP